MSRTARATVPPGGPGGATVRRRDAEMSALQKLVATEAIRDLQARYARHADAKEWEALADLFLPDGAFVPLGLDGEPQASLHGRDAIRDYVASGVGGGTATHHLFSYEIDVQSPTRAHGVWAMEDWIDRSHDEGPFKTLHGRGHYHADYRKIGAVWRIAHLMIRRTLLDISN